MALALVSGGAHATDAWSKLWITPAQQAQRLLEAGQPGAAAQLFKDPRLRAYAELRAGDYARAAKLLEPFHDARSEYNRGNALARAGRLSAALAAYDAALHAAPHDRDARHNRDLIARALEQQAAQRSGGSGSQGKRASAGSRNGRSSHGGSRGQGAQSQSAASQGAASRGASGQEASGAQSGSASASRAGSSPSNAGTPQQQAEQARQDAELAARLANDATRRGSQAQVGGTGRARGNGSAGADIAARRKARSAAGDVAGPPVSEQTLALEQWLRRIPDDPGGLLRRKFLIEHLERQQRAQAQGGGSEDGGP
ncbi:MAG: hypothetical protein ACRETB_11585 [Steroidobacteraceae bacterium]